MDKWQLDYIRKNLTYLTQNTKCNTPLLNYLEAKEIIKDFEKQELAAISSQITQSTELYQIIKTRINAYIVLIEALQDTLQGGAAKVLLEGLEKNDYPAWQKLQNPQDASNSVLDGPAIPQTSLPPPVEKEPTLEELKEDPEMKELLADGCYDFVFGNKDSLNMSFKKAKEAKDLPKGAVLLPKDASKGMAGIFNIIEFDGEPGKERFGALNDAKNLRKLFEALNYDVFPLKSKLEAKNKTKETMLTLIKEFRRQCIEEKPSSLIIFLGSHGKNPSKLKTSDGHYLDLEADVVSLFYASACPELKGIPKIFLIQACQNIVNDYDADFIKEDEDIYNIIVFEATYPGGKAYRCPVKGSWFVNSFISSVLQNAADQSIQQILSITLGKMEKLRKKNVIGGDQIPTLKNFTNNQLFLNI